MQYREIDIKNFPVHKRGNGSGNPENLFGLIDFCIDNVKEKDTVLELGCFYGASTAVFSHFAKHVVTVDINFNHITQEFINKYLNVELIRCSSLNVSNKFYDESFDIMYIDTVHTYDHCIKELSKLYSKCKINKYGFRTIGGHDYNQPGINKAVKEFFGRKPDNVYTDTSWVYYMKDNHGET